MKKVKERAGNCWC